MYEYRCKILRVVDGDTVDVDIDLGFGMWMHKERVRMMGIDTPESRTRDKVEKKFGLASKQFVKDMMPVGSKQVLKTQIDRSGEDKKGKFGRILGDFLIDGKKLTETIIKEGYGVVYTGQNKDQVEKAHLNNRKKLIKEGKVTL
jgi:micrococcal nuclease